MLIELLLSIKVLEDEKVVKAIEIAAHKVITDDDEATDKDGRFEEEMKIQREKTKMILSVMSANIKNWVYK